MKIFLYDEKREEHLLAQVVGDFLAGILPQAEIVVREDLFAKNKEVKEDLAEQLTLSRAELHWNNVKKAFMAEVNAEKEWLDSPTIKWRGMPYDAGALCTVYRDLMPVSELTKKDVNIVFTSRLIVTKEDYDNRPHARTAFFCQPTLISTTGLREAPAKPRAWYLLKQQEQAMKTQGLTDQLVEEAWLGYDDPRLTEVIKGYAAQAVFHQYAGHPFCDDASCRLFNAHWQEEMLKAQLNGSFCAKHDKALFSWSRNNGAA